MPMVQTRFRFIAVTSLAWFIGCGSGTDHGPIYNEGNGTAGSGGSGGSGGSTPVPEAGSIKPVVKDASPDAQVEATASQPEAAPTVDAAGEPPVEASVTPPGDGATVRPVCSDASVCGVTIKAEAAAIPADGRATDLISVALNPPESGQAVELTINGRGSWQSNGAKRVTVALDALGKGSALFLSDADGGLAVVTAESAATPDSASVAIDMPVLADIQIKQQYPIMGVKSSGFQESNPLTFTAVTSSGAYPKGLRMEIKHKPFGRSTLNALPSCSVTDCEVTDTVVIDDRGEATVSLFSGTLAGTAIVTITATAGGQTKVVTASSAIVGAKASGMNISLNCTPRNVPAMVDTDCTKSRINAPVQCTATLGDRFGNVVGVKTGVSFSSEAGNLVLPQTTLGYPDPGIGLATGTITTLGGRLPADVAAAAGERSLQFPEDVCSHIEHNPRDGVVTVMATMKGEEGFLDTNRDGEFNPGEPFIDLSEPYVDADDNNTQNGGELYMDLNNNRVWDGPNGKWDSSITLWTQTRILYSGAAAQRSVAGIEDLSRILPQPRQVPSGSGPGLTSLALRPQEVLDIGFFVSDANLNVLAPQTVYEASSSTGSANVTKAALMAPARLEGFFFKQEYCDADRPGTCSSSCPPSPLTTRCVVQAGPTSFEYGVAGSIHVVGSSPGGFNLLTSSNILGTTLLMEVPGTVLPPPP